MKKVKTKTKNALKFYTAKEVFKNASVSEVFRSSYSEEIARLKIARQIRNIRLAKNLTQREVAGRTQMPQSVIARIESGNHSFSFGTLNRIAQAFGKEVELV